MKDRHQYLAEQLDDLKKTRKDLLDIIDQVDAWRAEAEGGSGESTLVVTLCGKPTRITFTEKHLLDLQEMVRSDQP